LNTADFVPCPSCKEFIHVDAFPALLHVLLEGTSGESILTEDEAGCFYHPNKKAVISCSNCGRFLCALCDVEFNEQHLCTSCLEAGKKKRKIKNLENHRMLYDSLALGLAIIPMLLFVWPSILTAPIVVFLVVRYWKAPTSIIPRTKMRLIAALVIAVFQIIGWSIVMYQLIT
jgi:hypothetical protein